LEAGLKSEHTYTQPSSIILLQITDRETLEAEFEKFESLGISCASFYEPYEDMGMTAFATLPLGEEHRHLFKNYTLWGRSIKGAKTPLTNFLREEMKENQRQKKYKEEQKQTEVKNSDLVITSDVEKIDFPNMKQIITTNINQTIEA
jgi:hypothetical protein